MSAAQSCHGPLGGWGRASKVLERNISLTAIAASFCLYIYIFFFFSSVSIFGHYAFNTVVVVPYVLVCGLYPNIVS